MEVSDQTQFDVFLCHNSKDKKIVESIREKLRENGVFAFLDKYDFEPFLRWQDELEKIIPQIKAVAIFIGPSGIGPWADIEMNAFLTEFAHRKIRMGLVFLPGCPEEPKIPILMKSFTWIDFRHQDPEPMGQLIWGITGKKPGSQLLNVTPNIEKSGNNLSESSKSTFTQELGNGISLELVKIPAGEFRMGSPANELERNDNESPQHLVKVPGFWMGRYAVTQAQWRVVAELPKVERELDPDPSRFKRDNRPVEKVSWYEAVEFCQRLSQLTQNQKTYRLPSEAEWEYACRAGTTTPFYFGETITPELANFGRNMGITTKAWQFPPNAFGLYDMHGNVWEWCQDVWHGNYQDAPIDGSAWLKGGDPTLRVLRGGSWGNLPRNCRSAVRNRDASDLQYNDLGFRVVFGSA